MVALANAARQLRDDIGRHLMRGGDAVGDDHVAVVRQPEIGDGGGALPFPRSLGGYVQPLLERALAAGRVERIFREIARRGRTLAQDRRRRIGKEGRGARAARGGEEAREREGSAEGRGDIEETVRADIVRLDRRDALMRCGRRRRRRRERLGRHANRPEPGKVASEAEHGATGLEMARLDGVHAIGARHQRGDEGEHVQRRGIIGVVLAQPVEVARHRLPGDRAGAQGGERAIAATGRHFLYIASAQVGDRQPFRARRKHTGEAGETIGIVAREKGEIERNARRIVAAHGRKAPRRRDLPVAEPRPVANIVGLARLQRIDDRQSAVDDARPGGVRRKLVQPGEGRKYPV